MATSKAKTREKVEDYLSADFQSVDVHDKITEAYFGELGTPMMHKTRERVHWICENVYGNEVLDVGCSQGIVPILLAREGKKVTGLDLAEKSILQAEVYLEQEPKNVQDKVSFIHGDFLQHGFDEEKFDTIILGELLEHLVDPTPFIKTAVSLVKSDGRIIVTVPFGINDFPDHKRTYYFAGPYELIRDDFILEETKLFGKWIGFIARPKSQADRDVFTSIDLELLRAVEDAFFKIERHLTDQNTLLRQQLKELETRANEVNAKFEDKIPAIEGEFKSVSERYSLLQKRFVDQESLNNELASRIQNIRKSHNADKEKKLRQAAQLINLEAVNKERLRAMEEMQEKCEALIKKVSILENSLADAKESLKKNNKEDQKAGHEVLQIQQKYREILKENVLLKKQIVDSRDQLARIRNSRTFRFGRALIHGLTSWEGFIAMPGRILNSLQRQPLDEAARSGSSGSAGYKLADKSAGNSRSGQPRKLVGPKAATAKVITVLDEMSESCWDRELKIFPLSRESFHEQIGSSNSDFVFMESCWRGNRGTWEYAFTSPGLKHANAVALQDAIKCIKDRGLKIGFWNKEDPMHYDRFLPLARSADVIFTTDQNMLPAYRKDMPDTRVEVLPFAAQPELCNPAGRQKVENGTVCFAGSYYGVGHEDRTRQMNMLLPAIREFHGVIYDRMSNINSSRYRYPDEYAPYIRPAVPFEDMVNLYKSYKVFLNVNTIVDSPTMMSRRVYELLACGTPVVSTPSTAIDNQFEGIVQVASNEQEALKIVDRLLTDPAHHERISHVGYREVMTRHTYSDRLSMLLPAMGVAFHKRKPLVSIVLCTMRPEMSERIVENICRQTHDRIELILVLQNYSTDKRERLGSALKSKGKNIERLEIITDDSERALGARLNHGISLANGEFIAKMDDDDIYFENYLSDMIIPFKFGNYAVVGKKEIFVYLESSGKLIRRFPMSRHRLADTVSGATFVIKSDIAKKIPFSERNRGEDSEFIRNVRSQGHKIYACDPFNFIVWRGADKGGHTWDAGDEFFLNSSCIIESNELDDSIVRI